MVYRQNPPIRLSDAMWDYAKSLIPPAELSDLDPESLDYAQLKWGFEKWRNAAYRNLSNERSKVSTKTTPTYEMVNGERVPWYDLHKFDASCVSDVCLISVSRAAISFTAAIERLSEAGVVLTPDQMALVKKASTVEATESYAPVTPAKTTAAKSVTRKPGVKRSTERITVNGIAYTPDQLNDILEQLLEM